MFEINDKVKIHYKQMLIPAQIADKREIFGRTEYRLKLLEDGTEVSGWMTGKDIEPYES